ncbi:MAG: ADP-ribose pyrophosphatase [Gemmatimonadetes bacterium]|nr:ADP-ribose pyrophosphatase [Gemmatimonadota bacterium]
MTTGHARIHEPVEPGDTERGEIELIEERVLWENDNAQLRMATVRLPAHDGHESKKSEQFRLTPARGHAPGVAIVPIDDEDRILVERSFRHPPRMWVLEIPRGGREDGESVRDAAARELREELGYEMAGLFPLGRLLTDSGQLASRPNLVAVRLGARVPTEREPGETIDRVMRYSYPDLATACENGEIEDSFTLAATVRMRPHFQGDRFSWDPARAPRTADEG